MKSSFPNWLHDHDEGEVRWESGVVPQTDLNQLKFHGGDDLIWKETLHFY